MEGGSSLPVPEPLYRFGPFLLDPAERRLLAHGRPVEILPKAFDVLFLLVARHGSLVRKSEILEAVWPGVIVEENYLAVTISRIRAVLGDEASAPRYVETVPRFGYRFVAEVTRVPVAAPLPDEARPAEPIPHAQEAPSERKQWNRRARRAGVLAALAAAALGVAILRLQPHPPSGADASPLLSAATVPPAPHTSRQAALAAYKRGREIWWSRAGRRTEALDQFRLAVILDSTFALGWVGIADVHAFGYGTWDETRAALEKAFALEPDLGEAYATLAFVKAFQLWDWQGAEAALEQARRLAPDYVPALQWQATLRMVQRRPGEAAALLRQALTLEPTSASLFADLCQALYYERASDEALAACGRALEIDPQFSFARTHGFWTLLMDGRPRAALRWMAQHQMLAGVSERHPMHALLEAGEPGPFLSAYAAHLQVSEAPGALYGLAQVQATLGAHEAALETLERAVAIRQFFVPFANADPAFDALRDTPRFRALMARVGLSG